MQISGPDLCPAGGVGLQDPWRMASEGRCNFGPKAGTRTGVPPENWYTRGAGEPCVPVFGGTPGTSTRFGAEMVHNGPRRSFSKDPADLPPRPNTKYTVIQLRAASPVKDAGLV